MTTPPRLSIAEAVARDRADPRFKAYFGNPFRYTSSQEKVEQREAKILAAMSGEMSVAEIAAAVGLTPQSISHIVARLVIDDKLTRRRCKGRARWECWHYTKVGETAGGGP